MSSSAIANHDFIITIRDWDKLLEFNWLIKSPWQLRCPQTKQKSQQSLIFSSRAYALVSRGSRA